MNKTAFAIACHPDDIEFMMAGTLLKLRDAGYEIHCLNLANGSLGTNQFDYAAIVSMRRKEARNAARLIGAVFHESLVDDLEVYYERSILERLTPVIRAVAPEIILTHGPYDYMEDHINAGRLAVTAAFCRGMTNFKCNPPQPAIDRAVTVYHAMPHSLRDQLRRPVIPGIFVNIGSVIEQKKQMLACHKSQKEWLDTSQGSNAYLQDMTAKGRHYGRLSNRYEFAEGWIRHNNVGFCGPDDDPLTAALGADAFVNPEFERQIQMPH